jgi:hypothetical protein
MRQKGRRVQLLQTVETLLGMAEFGGKLQEQ